MNHEIALIVDTVSGNFWNSPKQKLSVVEAFAPCQRIKNWNHKSRLRQRIFDWKSKARKYKNILNSKTEKSDQPKRERASQTWKAKTKTDERALQKSSNLHISEIDGLVIKTEVLKNIFALRFSSADRPEASASSISCRDKAQREEAFSEKRAAHELLLSCCFLIFNNKKVTN